MRHWIGSRFVFHLNTHTHTHTHTHSFSFKGNGKTGDKKSTVHFIMRWKSQFQLQMLISSTFYKQLLRMQRKAQQRQSRQVAFCAFGISACNSCTQTSWWNWLLMLLKHFCLFFWRGPKYKITPVVFGTRTTVNFFLSVVLLCLGAIQKIRHTF